MQNRYIYSIIFGFTIGILSRSFINLGWSFVLLFFLTAAATVVSLRLTGSKNLARHLPLFLFAVAVSFGILRFDIYENRLLHSPMSGIEGIAPSRVSVTGVVRDEVDVRDNHQRFPVKVFALDRDGKSEPIRGRLLVIAPHYPEVSYGDVVKVDGTLKKPQNFETLAGREFNYRAFLRREGILFELVGGVEIVERGKGNIIKGSLLRVKGSFMSKLAYVIPEPEVSLAVGILLGAKHSLGQEILEKLRRAGVIHVVVLSGYNITVVAESVRRFLSRFAGRKFSLTAAAVSIALFVVMTGATATGVRAAIMALILVLARLSARRYVPARALFLAGFLMILHNPMVLAFDPSFQLSFLATVGLVYLSPIFEAKLRFLPERLGIRGIAASTIATQLSVLPLLLYMSSQFSIVSLPANLLILFFIPATMFLTFLTGLTASVAVALSLPFAYGAFLLLFWELWVGESFGRLPFAALDLSIPLWSVVAIYCLIAVGCLRYYSLRRQPTA